jgi:hypothetical protein
MLHESGVKQGIGIGGHTLPNRGEYDTWLTPPMIIELLGPFDLDPCAAPSPRPWPTAKKHIELPQNGLTERWEGRVWMNPPYGEKTGLWLEKLADHGNGIALIFARTETLMFREFIWGRASALLFFYGRLSFYFPSGQQAGKNAGGPSVLVAYGENNAARLLASGLGGAFVKGWRR